MYIHYSIIVLYDMARRAGKSEFTHQGVTYKVRDYSGYAIKWRFGT